MGTKYSKTLMSLPEDDSSTTNTTISPDIQLILDTLFLTSINGYLSRKMSKMDIKTIKTLKDLGFSIDETKKFFHRNSFKTYFVVMHTIKWENATQGEALKIRDLTYKALKNSLYPLMKISSIQGLKTFMIPPRGWLVNTNKLSISGLEYFEKDGLECIIDSSDHSIIGFSWKYSTFGFGLELQQFSSYGILKHVLPYLKMVFERDGEDSRVVIDDKLTPYQLKYLAEKENIHFENGEFFKRK
jgi:hypothetical protein